MLVYKMWDNLDDELIISSIPKEVKDEILKYKKDKIFPEQDIITNNRKIIEKRIIQLVEENDRIQKPDKPNIPFVPNDIEMRDYQWEAYNEWEQNNYHGILAMATGTGKTITALNSLVQLYNKKKKLFVIIVCPYQHLVEQWVEDIERFNITPIIGYSKSKQKSWKAILRNQVNLFNFGKDESFCCFITTNASYSKPDTQRTLSKLKDDTLLIVDEAHNIGSETGIQGLLESYKYRLALSATFKRKYDELGTERIKDYFNDVVFTIGIEEAIFTRKCLVEYDYFPILTFLNDNEFNRYKELTKRIAKGTKETANGATYLTQDAMLAANMRSLLIAGSSDKIEKLTELIPDFKRTKNNLIYCGAAKVALEDMPETIITEEEEYRQVDYVRDLLFKNGVIAARFTAEEDVEQRKLIKEQFTKGTIGTVVAIKCLDEGVNIPSIERAFILASSKDEKQYIQRRGRVLRKFERWGYKKEKAIIYDFIALPFQIDYAYNYTDNDYKVGKGLVLNELDRIHNFYETCSNKSHVEEIINELNEVFQIESEGEEDGQGDTEN